MILRANSDFTCLRPGSLREALGMLRDEGPLVPLAGCTDLYVNLQFGTITERRFIDLWPLAELRGITSTRSSVRIGALTTFAAIIQSPLVRRRLPMLVAAAREIGGRQIQNRATIGGNIANASPAGDSLPVLAAAEAIIILQSARGERRVPFTEYYTGYRASVRQADEVISAIDVPNVEGYSLALTTGVTVVAEVISLRTLLAIRRTLQPLIARDRARDPETAAKRYKAYNVSYGPTAIVWSGIFYVLSMPLFHISLHYGSAGISTGLQALWRVLS